MRAWGTARREAEQRVAKAKAEFEVVRLVLCGVKAGRSAVLASLVLVLALLQCDVRERAAFGVWARVDGREVAGQGVIRKEVQGACGAAHTGRLVEAS
ncbi:hypothetical protein ACFQ0G_53980 [Streptomyces chiangmaiensis]|uniref:hypothetical protein n=1 Tax=Streptomyces chiangmaiensis TaxID=766497 RepID=UPI0031E7ED30